MIRLGIYGSTGRMGQTIIQCLKDSSEFEISVLHAIEEFEFNIKAEVTDSIDVLLDKSDVIIDFTIPDATSKLVQKALQNPKPIVIGTTGLTEHISNLIEQLSQKVPILYATNMSLGVAVLNKLIYLASKTLSEFDIEIVEQHHRHKKDAPSGTALTLAKTAAIARDLKLDNVRISGRDGQIGARSKDEIGVLAIRGGDVAGRHTVGFYNDGEFIELNHTATSRATFAKGALKAASWLVNQKNGLYGINDCLGL